MGRLWWECVGGDVGGVLKGVGGVSCVGSGDCSRGRKGEEEVAHAEEIAGATGQTCSSGSADASVDAGDGDTAGTGFGGMGAAYLPTLSLLIGMDGIAVVRLLGVERGTKGVAAWEPTLSDPVAVWLLSCSQFGLFFRNQNLNMFTWDVVRVPIASASFTLLLDLYLTSAPLKRSISDSLHCWRLVVFPAWASFIAASCARCSHASAMCLSHMWWEQDNVDGNMRGQNGQAFSSDP